MGCSLWRMLRGSRALAVARPSERKYDVFSGPPLGRKVSDLSLKKAKQLREAAVMI